MNQEWCEPALVEMPTLNESRVVWTCSRRDADVKWINRNGARGARQLNRYQLPLSGVDIVKGNRYLLYRLFFMYDPPRRSRDWCVCIPLLPPSLTDRYTLYSGCILPLPYIVSYHRWREIGGITADGLWFGFIGWGAVWYGTVCRV